MLRFSKRKQYKSFFNICIGILFSLLLISCDTVGSIDKFQHQDTTQIFNGGILAMKHGNYLSAIDHFSALEKLYPDNKYAEKILIYKIYAYYKQNKNTEVLANCDRFLKVYPMSNNIDYVYYMRGVVNMKMNQTIVEKFLPYDPAERDLTSLKLAFSDFNLLIKAFPQSRYLVDARQRMIFIHNILARYYLRVANFYYLHSDYIATINNANTIIINYQTSDSVPYALVLLIKSYQALKLTKEAQLVLQVFHYNYPHSPLSKYILNNTDYKIY